MRSRESVAIAALAVVLAAPASAQSQSGTIRVHVEVPGIQAPIPGVQLSLTESLDLRSARPAGTLTSERPAVLDLPDNEQDLLAYLQELARARGIPPAAPGPPTPPPIQASAVTDLDGNATFENLKPGRYIVGAMREGYVAVINSIPQQTRANSTSITATVGPESPVADVSFSFNPGATISGRVMTAGGAAVSNVRVTLGTLRALPSGQRGFSTTGIGALADANGEYRLPLVAPGVYSLRVEPLGTPVVYYPGTVDLEKATSFSIETPGSFIEAGQNITNIDIVMP